MSNKITTDVPDRTVNVVDSQVEGYIEIEIRPKEAIDLYNALTELEANAEQTEYTHDDVQEMVFLTLGGLHFPNGGTLYIGNTLHADIVLCALEQHNPIEADFTDRLQNAILDAIDEHLPHITPTPIRKKNPAMTGETFHDQLFHINQEIQELHAYTRAAGCDGHVQDTLESILSDLDELPPAQEK